MYREQWLNEALDKGLRDRFKDAGHPLPEKIRVSVGWPGGRGPKRSVIGQCWPASTVEDGVVALFVSPVLDDPVEVLTTLTHEAVHSIGMEGHRKEFGEVAAAVGLTRPWRSTPATDELKDYLRTLAEQLGPYDHGKIKTSAIIRQTTRLLKVTCPDDGYTARITRKWIDYGLPVCPCGTEMEEAV
jgi:hypothetical protein